MTEDAPRSAFGRWAEYLLAFGVLVVLGRALWWLYAYGHLPQPFFYEAFDTFMDWFNTAYWARTNDAYESWKSIYPPLSFVILRLIGKPSCYLNADALSLRDCDWVGIAAIHLIYVVNLVLVVKTFLRIDRQTAMPRAIALMAGMPMLYALERGNILTLCFAAVILAFGPLIRSARIRWLFAGLAINFKVYLVAAVAAQLLKRRWLWFEGAILSTILVYIVTYGLYGGGTPGEIIRNIADYSAEFTASQVLDVWYPVTYQPLIAMLSGDSFPSSSAIGSQVTDVALLILPNLVRLGQLSIVAAAVATWLRPEVVPNYRLAFFGVAIALITSEAGGYTEILIILFVFMEPWRGIARPIAILCCYLLSFPGDIALGAIPPITRESYLAGHEIEVHFSIALGMFLRPGLVIIIAVSLSCATLRDVWKDIREQGWKGRWRYRRDWPLLPGIARPSRPADLGGE